MKLNFRNLPIANLPYEDVNACKQMMLRLYENIPYLAELPKIDPNDNITLRTVENIPGIVYKDKKINYWRLYNFVFYEIITNIRQSLQYYW